MENQEQDLTNELNVRHEKLEKLRQEGNAFPNDFRRDHISSQIHEKYDALDNETLEAEKHQVKIAGRLVARRIMGKASFGSIQDMGGRIQIYAARDALPEGVYQDVFKKLDLGDIVGAEGYVFKTKTCELSVHLSNIRLLTKALRPLPEKFKGLQDQEARCRQRYLDLIANEKSRNTFIMRSRIIQEIRI